jgi:hypothetical protein
MFAMKTFLSILILPLISIAQIQYYTLSTTTVGPGMIHKNIIAPKIPWNINVLEVDLTNPFVTMKTIKANNRIIGRETTTSMAARISSSEHLAVGAINGDFWASDGTPLGTQIVNGQILKNPNYWSTIGFDYHNHPVIAIVSFSGQINTGAALRNLNGVNEIRDTNELILYNQFYGSSTKTNEYGTEVRILPVNSWYVNDTLRCLVDKVETGIGDIGLLPGSAVLSGHGEVSTFLINNVTVGDTIEIYLALQPGLERMTQMVSGFPRIVNNGQNYALQGYTQESGASDFAEAYHPRSAVGFSADSTKFYMIAADGRQSISRGMSLIELADFMISLGVAQGVNLDGGGSTTLVVHGEIENSPSDGSERPVANVLTAISLAPAGILSDIQIKPDYFRLFLGQSVNFVVTGWDQHYNPVPLDPTEFEFTIAPKLGTIDTAGHFVSARSVDSGYVYIQYDNLSDSAYVRIKTVNTISISPKHAVVDSLGSVQFTISATDEDDLPASLRQSDYQWSNLDPTVGSIDSAGTFTGFQEGEATIVVRFADLSDTAHVSVQFGDEKAVIDSMDSIEIWDLNGVLYDSSESQITLVDTPRTIGTGAMQLYYQFIRSAEGRSYINLNTDISIYGVPDSILLDIKSDGERHWVNLIVSDDNDELFKGSTGQFADLAGSYDTLSVPTEKLFAIFPSSNFYFPIRFRTIEIRLGYTTAVDDTNRGTICLDNLRVTYPGITSSLPLLFYNLPRNTELHQNYPNPFNAFTRIKFQTAGNGKVELSVYDILGQKVAELVNQRMSRGYHEVSWDAEALASGIYFYRLEVKNSVFMKKMILLK